MKFTITFALAIFVLIVSDVSAQSRAGRAKIRPANERIFGVGIGDLGIHRLPGSTGGWYGPRGGASRGKSGQPGHTGRNGGYGGSGENGGNDGYSGYGGYGVNAGHSGFNRW